MKRVVSSCALLVLAIGTAASAASDWTYDVSTGVFGNYVFRGIRRTSTADITEGTASWQVTKPLSLNARAVNVMSFAPKNGDFENRYDLYGKYKATKTVSLSAGWLYYDWNKGISKGMGPDTQEAYGGIETTWLGIRPSAYVFYDYKYQRGLYAVATVSKSWALGKTGWTLDTLGAAGFDFGPRLGYGSAVAPKINGFRNGLISADLNYQLAKGVEFGPRFDLQIPARAIDPNKTRVNADAGLGFNLTGRF